MECLAQLFLRERPGYFAVLGNVNRVFQTLCSLAVLYHFVIAVWRAKEA